MSSVYFAATIKIWTILMNYLMVRDFNESNLFTKFFIEFQICSWYNCGDMSKFRISAIIRHVWYAGTKWNAFASIKIQTWSELNSAFNGPVQRWNPNGHSSNSICEGHKSYMEFMGFRANGHPVGKSPKMYNTFDTNLQPIFMRNTNKSVAKLKTKRTIRANDNCFGFAWIKNLLFFRNILIWNQNSTKQCSWQKGNIILVIGLFFFTKRKFKIQTFEKLYKITKIKISCLVSKEKKNSPMTVLWMLRPFIDSANSVNTIPFLSVWKDISFHLFECSTAKCTALN